MSSKVQLITEQDSQIFYETFGTHDNVTLQWDEYVLFPAADEDFCVNSEKEKETCPLTACDYCVS